jgi:glycosyltransferase involved in cell wall biosynthesis
LAIFKTPAAISFSAPPKNMPRAPRPFHRRRRRDEKPISRRRNRQAGKYTKIFSGFPLEPFLAAKNDLELRKNWESAGRFRHRQNRAAVQAQGPRRFVRRRAGTRPPESKIKFLLVGDGEWRGRFENLARSGLEKNLFSPASFRQPKFHDTSASWMRSFICRCAKACRALPQALAAGKPVVAYDCDGAAKSVSMAKPDF